MEALTLKVMALYDPEELESIERFDLQKAQTLDSVIAEHVDNTADGLELIAGLVSYARAGLIHEVLGYPSWTVYIRERLQPLCQSYDVQTRRDYAIELHRQGMSIRDAAEATGQSKSVVGRQVSHSGTPDGSAPRTTDRNGKTQNRIRPQPTKPSEVRSYQKKVARLTGYVERIASSVADFVQSVKDDHRIEYLGELEQTRDALQAQISLLDKIIERSRT